LSDSAMLLRMLEPAVRPVGPTAGAPARPTAQPFEHRSFESLLSEAHEKKGISPFNQEKGLIPFNQLPGQDAQAGPGVAEATSRTDTLGPLRGLNTVENATLRQIMANHAAAASNGE